MDGAALKERVIAEVDRLADQLIEVSHEIHAHPELNFEERFAADLLCRVIAEHGHEPQRGAHGVDTGFVADVGQSDHDDAAAVGVCLEYDALPGIGHACGHNIIAAAGLGASLAAAAVAAEAGGRLRILGTPAEEGGGGKVHMADQGAFDGLHAALMIHPAGADLPAMDVIATSQVHVDYQGRSSHAAAAPERGRNALDAAVLGYMGVGALRQHIGERERVHGVFTEGGKAPNVVPDHAQTHWMIRSTDLDGLQDLQERVMAALEAGATATGCSCSAQWHDVTYAGMRHNGPLVAAYAANSARIGRPLLDPADPATPRVSGSTDMANVSHLVPSIHPMIAVSPPDVAIHTPDFTRYAGGPEGDRAVVDGAKALAMTVVDVWLDEGLRTAAHDDFEATGGRAHRIPGL